jgi:hypothetical protein
MNKIPTYQDSTSNFEQEIILGGRLMIITLVWNSRSEAWYMTIEDSDSSDIVRGIKLVPNWMLLKQYQAYLPNFKGDIILIASDSDVEERVSYDNLNNGYQLTYVDETEKEAWEDYYGVG